MQTFLEELPSLPLDEGLTRDMLHTFMPIHEVVAGIHAGSVAIIVPHSYARPEDCWVEGPWFPPLGEARREVYTYRLREFQDKKRLHIIAGVAVRIALIKSTFYTIPQTDDNDL